MDKIQWLEKRQPEHFSLHTDDKGTGWADHIWYAGLHMPGSGATMLFPAGLESTSCVTLGKQLNLINSQFSSWVRYYSPCKILEFKEITHLKGLLQCPTIAYAPEWLLWWHKDSIESSHLISACCLIHVHPCSPQQQWCVWFLK